MLHRIRPLRVLALAALATLLAGAGQAAPSTAPTIDPKAKAILEKYVEATGGRAAYEAVKSRMTKATLEIVGQNITGTVVTKQVLPDKLFVVSDMAGIGQQEQALVGDIAWSRSAMAGLHILDGKELEQLKVQSTAEQAALNPEKYYSSIKYMAEETVGTTPVDTIEVEGPAGKFVESFDKATGFLLQMKMTVASPQGDLPMVATMADYKDVGGVKIPHSNTLEFGGGAFVLKTVVTEAAVNGDIPPDTFKIPADVQAEVDKAKSEKK